MARTTLHVDVNDIAARASLRDMDQMIERLHTSAKSIKVQFNGCGQAISETREFANAAGDAVRATVRLDAATGQLRSSQVTVKQSLQDTNSATQSLTQSTTFLERALTRLSGVALSAVTNSFRNALKEMKAVDSELVIVRKVTDATDEQLSALRDRAYEVGKAYGVVASDYLSSAAQFSRAGYKEQAGDLAELATKLQLVGDVSQDVANQFLIATDKAYGLKGNYEQLSVVIDQLNEIDNNYATSIEKIAQGMGIIAPIASQAHVSIEELAAAIGTITATTQRSGSESARALRAIFLNIMGDTKTEIEDGATWTAGEIEGLRDVLKLYAKDVVDAAEKTGQVINPMEAIAALSQSYKEGVLTEAKLMEMISDIGGKLRSSQLMALIQNWDMYNEMIGTTADAIGSADKEVSNALTGWEAKLNILKNTWTDFVQQTIDSALIKNGIDFLTNAVKWTGNLGNALQILSPIIAKLAIQKIVKDIRDLGSSASGASVGLNLLTIALTGLMVLYRQHNNKIQENIAAAQEQSAKSEEAARSLGKLYLAYVSAEKGSDAFLEASKSLREALGEEKTAADELSDSYKRLLDKKYTKAQYDRIQEALKDARNELTLAKANATDAFSNTIEEIWNGLGVDLASSFGLLDSSKIGEKANKLLKESGLYYADHSVFGDFITGNKEGGHISLTTYDDRRKLYEVLPDVLEAIEDYATETRNPSLLGSLSGYSSLSNLYSLLQLEFDPIVAAEEKLKKLEAEEKVLGRLVMTGEKTKEEVEQYLEENKTGDKEFDEFLEGLVYEYYPQYVDESKKVAEGTDEVKASIDGLSEALKKSEAAIESYNDTLKKGEKGDTLKSYAKIYARAKELYSQGLIGSNEYQASIRTLLGNELGSLYDWNYAAAGADIFNSKLFKAMFEGGGEDYGLNLAKYLKKNIDSFKQVIDVVNEADGSFGILIKDHDALASSLGVTPELLYAFIDAWDIFDESVTLTGKDVESLLEKYKDAFKGITVEGKKFVDVASLLKGLAMDNYTTDQIIGIIDALRDLQDAGTIELSADVDNDEILMALSEIDEMRDELTDRTDIEVEIISNKDEFYKDFFDTLEDINKSAFVFVSIVPKAATASDLHAKSYEWTDEIEHMWNERERSKHWYDPMDTIKFPRHPTLKGESRASGGISKGGLALVNDGEGAELIRDNGRAYIAGDGKPTIVRLGRGARVFNAKETSDILRRSGVSAYADGSYSGGFKENSQIGISSSSSALDLLKQYFEQILNTAETALNDQLAAIDAQMLELRYGVQVAEQATDLEEARLEMIKAEQNLTEAQTERTVRYFNKATGQWEWMADKRSIVEAQEALADAQKDYLQEQYKALETAVQSLLERMQNTSASGSVADIGTILAMLGSNENLGDIQGVLAQINSFIDNPGAGLALLDSAAAASVLLPKSGSSIANLTGLTALYGISTGDVNAKGQSIISTLDRSSTTYGNTYYINGVKIGSDMLDKPLSEVLSVLPIYAN